MKRTRIHDLQVGQTVNTCLFSASGQKLLNAGVELTERHLQALRRCGDTEVLEAASLDELLEAGVVDRFDSSALKVGQKATQGVVSKTGQVLLEAGDEIEEHHLDAIAAGGAAFAVKGESDASPQTPAADPRRERILMADAIVDGLESHIKELDLHVQPVGPPKWIVPGDRSDWPDPATLAERRGAAVQTLRKAYARIEAGLTVPIVEFEALANQLIGYLAKHPRRFTQLALLVPRREDYLPDHAYTATVLAMAMAAQLHWPLEHVRRIGTAGLIYDLGMLLVPERIRTGACELTEVDRGRVQRHPVFSLSMMQAIETVEPLVQVAALQHHERENGSGYPKGIRRDQVSDYARVLAVADSFAAITEPRHYRQEKLPYIAMEETVRSAGSMSLWKPAVRALVQVAGLFPVGSYVRLSDGRDAHIIASNPDQLDRPEVQPLDDRGQPAGDPIDLAPIPKKTLAIARPVQGPVAG